MLEIYSFDLLPYRSLTAFPGWPFPNSLFDPGRGAVDYAEHIEEAVLCEELGFDGVIFNEHHCSAYGLMPSPNLVAATLAARTTRMKIGVLGSALPLRGHPVRVAEEYAMLDCLSRGRFIAGLIRGVPNEYFAYNVRPAESRARFEEAHDIVVKAWTEEWMNFEGKYYQYKNYTLWPRPLQKPHPPIWVPANSLETIEWTAQRRYTVAQTFAGTELVKAAFDQHRKVAGTLGWTPPPSTYALMRHIYVSSSDEHAREECEAAITYFAHLLERAPNVLALYGDTGAGYVNPGAFDYKGMKVALDFSNLGYERMDREGWLIAGSVDTVIDKIRAQQKETGFGKLLGIFCFGNLRHDLVTRNLRLFAAEVAPHVRGLA
jgi:alkanesulfonate monooxygenase SsuD/methylene tetrahydromethanopterin reductase-like flavin-dependent oxidoreductase (luciferase family)